MKIFYFITILLISIGLNAQKIEFTDLLNKINWNDNKSNFSNKFIKNGTISKENEKTPIGFTFNNVVIGEVETNASVYFDSITNKISEINFSFQHDDKNFKPFSDKMDKYLFQKLDTPDVRTDEPDRIKRTWFKDNYIIDSHSFSLNDFSLYSLTIKNSISKIMGFRDFPWGENKINIEKKEGKPNILKDYSDYYAFDSQIADLDCSVVYNFIENKLVNGKYVFNEKHSNKNDYINDLNNLVDLLSIKYGKPVKSDYSIYWKNNLYKKNPSDYGLAVALGHLTYHYYWNDENTDLSIKLFGDNGKINLVIIYDSVKYKDLKINNNNKNKLKGL